jgi:DNA-binding transcriptional ArsR family regulator
MVQSQKESTTEPLLPPPDEADAALAAFAAHRRQTRELVGVMASDVQLDILLDLAHHGRPASVAELAARMNITRPRLRYHLRRLERLGLTFAERRDRINNGRRCRWHEIDRDLVHYHRTRAGGFSLTLVARGGHAFLKLAMPAPA